MTEVKEISAASRTGQGALEKQLEERLRLNGETSRLARGRPNNFLRLLDRLGAVAACKRSIMRRQPTDWFITLWHLNRLELSPEAAVLHGPWRILFDPEVLEKARSNLRDYERPDLADYWRSIPGY